MAQPIERTPWGPWTDYSHKQGGAEESAAAVVEQILSDGGLLLWQKYLERKAFGFAADAVTDAILSQLRMCFVAHDEGEDCEAMGDGWELEDEPEPTEIDSWARMHLPVRRSMAGDGFGAQSGVGAGAKGKSPAELRKMQQILRSRTSDTRSRAAPKMGKTTSDKSEARSYPIQDDIPIDEEEEQLREAKQLEESRKRDRERRAKETEKTKEMERQKVQVLHEEMARRAHTFDSEGNLIWVEEFKMEKLPRVQDIFPYSIKRDPRQRTGEFDAKTGPQSPPASPGGTARGNRKERGRRKKQDRTAKAEHAEQEFTDSFSKLQHGQPPVLETMQVATGVTLESQGKKKSGPEPNFADRQMSRKEYVQLAEREVAMDGAARSEDAARAAAKQAAAAAAQESVGSGGAESPTDAAGDGSAGAGSPGALGSTLPPLNRTQRGLQGVSSPGSGGLDRDKVQKAPQAPPPSTRAKRFEAIGPIRPPRYHAPALGGPYGFGSAQPPLGATMGHGLLRHGSMKEAYFFPSPVPELPTSMLRSSSEAALGSGRRHPPSGSNTPKRERSLPVMRDIKGGGDKTSAGPSQDEPEDPDMGGKLRPEQSPAYRKFRDQLFPENQLSTSLRSSTMRGF